MVRGLAANRARILAGQVDADLDEIERLLARPSNLSVHKLRLDPLWVPPPRQPRFKVKQTNSGPVLLLMNQEQRYQAFALLVLTVVIAMWTAI